MLHLPLPPAVLPTGTSRKEHPQQGEESQHKHSKVAERQQGRESKDPKSPQVTPSQMKDFRHWETSRVFTSAVSSMKVNKPQREAYDTQQPGSENGPVPVSFTCRSETLPMKSDSQVTTFKYIKAACSVHYNQKHSSPSFRTLPPDIQQNPQKRESRGSENTSNNIRPECFFMTFRECQMDQVS